MLEWIYLGFMGTTIHTALLRHCLPSLVGILIVLSGCQKEKEVVTVYSNTVIHMDTIIYVDTVLVPPGAVADGAGYVYPTTIVGGRRWMAENLRTSRYSNGDPIPFVPTATQWGGLDMGAWCYYDGDAGYDTFHGKLYNWDAASDSRNVCPLGWHVPTDEDWQELEAAVGVDSAQLNSTGPRGVAGNAGGQLKSMDMWNAPNQGATDSYEFDALPGGLRFEPGGFGQSGTKGYWWSSTELDSLQAWQRSLSNDNRGIYRFPMIKPVGASIRCVED